MLKNFPGNEPQATWSAFCKALFTTTELQYMY